jgi:dienelactone hydrolase
MPSPLDLHGFQPGKSYPFPGDTARAGQSLATFANGEGDPLILLHELPGLSEPTFALGGYFVRKGFRVVLPLLFGQPGQENVALGLCQTCLRQELREVWRGGANTILARVIRAIAAEEWAAYKDVQPDATGVGVVGMCFTGSMVLALLLDDDQINSVVKAPVLAQPSSGYGADVLKTVADGTSKGPILSLRFERDFICRQQHFDKLKTAFQACPAGNDRLIVYEFLGGDHSTLVYDYDPDHPLKMEKWRGERFDAREVVSSFLRKQLQEQPRP